MSNGQLPPQPTDTALARQVQRAVDAARRALDRITGKEAKRLRDRITEQNLAIGRLMQTNQFLHDENRALYLDIKNLAERHNVAPMIERVSALADYDLAYDIKFIRISVRYAKLNYQAEWPAVKERRISKYGQEMLAQVAREIADKTAHAHAEHIINATLAQGIFKA